MIVIYKEYPHVDVTARADDLWRIVEATLTGLLRPTMALHDCRMIGIFPTTREPMQGLVARMTALEGNDGIARSSGERVQLVNAGSRHRVLVVADRDHAEAEAPAPTFGREISAMRESMSPPFINIEGAVRALRATAGRSR